MAGNQGPAVHLAMAARLGNPDFLHRGRDEYPENRRVILDQRDGDAPAGFARDKVFCAVDRIDHPSQFGASTAMIDMGFFRKPARFGKQFFEFLPQKPVDRQIGVADDLAR